MRKRNARGRFTSQTIDVRKPSQIPELETMISNGPSTFILIYADWCGHCQRYKPTWNDFETMPGRTANIASVHHDMMEQVPVIANAKIEGYPSVIKVEPSGKIEEYSVPGSRETTNAIPIMRDVASMKKELTAAPAVPTVPATPTVPAPPRNTVNNVRNVVRNTSRGTLRNKVPANLMSGNMPRTIPLASIADPPKIVAHPEYRLAC